MNGDQQTTQYTCPNCGFSLAFDPASGHLVCSACGSAFAVAANPAPPVPPAPPAAGGSAVAAPASAGDDLSAANCPSCGAGIVILTETLAATKCVYCRSPLVLAGRLADESRPDTVVPFAVSRAQAEMTFRQWLAKKRYAPEAFRDPNILSQIEGVYFPYFAVSGEVSSRLEASLGQRSEPAAGTDDSSTPRPVLHAIVEGEAAVEDLPCRALRTIRTDRMMPGLLPYDLRHQAPFSAQYLAGFRAERPDVSFEEAAPGAERGLDIAARQAFASDLLRQDASTRSIHVWGESRVTRWHYRMTLLPVWMVYLMTADGEPAYLGVNGQTGAAAGVLPVDTAKLKRHVNAIMLGAIGLGLMIAVPFALSGLLGGEGGEADAVFAWAFSGFALAAFGFIGFIGFAISRGLRASVIAGYRAPSWSDPLRPGTSRTLRLRRLELREVPAGRLSRDVGAGMARVDTVEFHRREDGSGAELADWDGRNTTTYQRASDVFRKDRGVGGGGAVAAPSLGWP
ncbi:MAG: TFIIB-type zinc ribbon-containing protein [Bifidobacteriaceae bacterium]|jgi:DNA-directed RNA polymerase subunit RPC12/RpoP|nr:TFIIB-type zinc ribbon-containing protein [Bifidobacteriaceae bacterium]